MIVLEVAPGKTKDDALAWLKANQAGPASVDPAANNGGTAEFSSGKHGWLTVDLTPGTWFAFNNTPGLSANVPVFVAVGATGTLPRSGGMDGTVASLLGAGLLATGWFLRRKTPRRI